MSTKSILAHQFDDLNQQRESATLGMWAFLATELLFFGALFTSFLIYRIYYIEAFRLAAHHHLDFWLGTVNTGVLLCSSFTVVLAVHSAAHGRRIGIIFWFAATIALACVFLGIKAVEYTHEFQHGLVPGKYWTYSGPLANQLKLFMSFYFIMTGIHALHMIVGIGIFLYVIFRAWRGDFTHEYFNPVEISGLYWHFVDIVWIFLFPTLYLLP